MTASLTEHAVLSDTYTPAQRLAASRQRLVMFMAKGDADRPNGHQADHIGTVDGEKSSAKSSALHKVLRTAGVWWRHHPAKLALEIAEPALQQYAAHKPFQLLGIAAVAGAATVFIRPWRLVSVTGLLLAALKSSGMANMALSLTSSHFKSLGSQRQQSLDS